MSLYLWGKESPFRIFCYKMSSHKAWDNTVIVLIMLSSIKLATDTYNYRMDPDSVLVTVLEYLDILFNILFIIEMVVKIISMGLTMDNGSYLEESWNQLDFFIVNSSILDMSLSNFDMPFIRILRMLRVLRPLRFISRNPNLKMIVVALFDSIGSIFNVIIVIAMVFLIFAILGVNTMGGYFFYCSIDMY